MVKELNIGMSKNLQAAVNKSRIKEFFKKNPYKTQQDCAKSLGIHYVTVCRHFKRLRAEAEGK